MLTLALGSSELHLCLRLTHAQTAMLRAWEAPGSKYALFSSILLTLFCFNSCTFLKMHFYCWAGQKFISTLNNAEQWIMNHLKHSYCDTFIWLEYSVIM